MSDNAFNLDDLENALAAFNEIDVPPLEMTDEMKASQKRYEDYLKKKE